MDARQDKEYVVLPDSTYLIDYNRHNGRKKSSVTLTHRETGESSTLSTIRMLAQGSYGSTREFTNGKLSIAVKNLHDKSTYFKTLGDRISSQELMVHEVASFKRCYPKEAPTALLTWPEFDLLTYKNYPYKLDNRIILPLIKGDSLEVWVKRNKDPDLLALVIFNLAKELQRLHDFGFLHGDVSSRNVLITDNLTAHFIDMDFSYNIDDDATVFGPIDPAKTYIAPERLNIKDDESVAANYTQDTYSLAWTLNNLIDHLTPHLREAFYLSYPEVRKFFNQSITTIVDKRPSLQSLITALSPRLYLAATKLGIRLLNGADLVAFFKTRITVLTTSEVNHLLYKLCLRSSTDKLEAINQYLTENEPVYQNSQITFLIATIIELKKKWQQIGFGTFYLDERNALTNQLANCMNTLNSILDKPMAELQLDAEVSDTEYGLAPMSISSESFEM